MEYFYHYQLCDDKIKEMRDEINQVVERYSDKVEGNISTMYSNQYHLNDECRGKFPISLQVLKDIIADCLGETNVYMSNGWTVYGKRGGYHVVHRHNLESKDIKDICTVTYLDVGEEDEWHCGNLFFFIKGEARNFTPSTGDVIVFPGSMYHGTYPQTSEMRQTLNIDFNRSEEYFPKDFLA